MSCRDGNFVKPLPGVTHNADIERASDPGSVDLAKVESTMPDPAVAASQAATTATIGQICLNTLALCVKAMHCLQQNHSRSLTTSNFALRALVPLCSPQYVVLHTYTAGAFLVQLSALNQTQNEARWLASHYIIILPMLLD